MATINKTEDLNLANPKNDYFWFEHKYNDREKHLYTVQWLFEQSIYAISLSRSTRLRVLAILTPIRIEKDESFRSYVIGYEGGNTSNPSNGLSGNLLITSDYSIFDYPTKDEITKLNLPSSNYNLARRFEFPSNGSQHNNHYIYWAHDVSHSDVYAKYNGQTYRVLQILLPSFILLPSDETPATYPMGLLTTAYLIGGDKSQTQLIRGSIIDQGFIEYP